MSCSYVSYHVLNAEVSGIAGDTSRDVRVLVDSDWPLFIDLWKN